jgi:CubicO group peptidase (beta-lactamase class C family)
MLATMWKRLVLALAIFGMASASRGQEAKPKPNDDLKSRQERIENGIEPIQLGSGQDDAKLSLAELMKLYKDPGLTVAVIDGYKIAWTKAYGTTDLGGKAPVTTKTLFQAGSISKPVAATGMLALVQAGKLALDEKGNVAAIGEPHRRADGARISWI